MENYPSYDAIVLGGGSGGIGFAIRAACGDSEGGHGRSVLLVEGAKLGGTCVHTGCVPNRLLYELARRVHLARTCGEWGIRAINSAAGPRHDKQDQDGSNSASHVPAPAIDFKLFKQKREEYICCLATEAYPTHLNKAGVTVARGKASILPDSPGNAAGGGRAGCKRWLVRVDPQDGSNGCSDDGAAQGVVRTAQVYQTDHVIIATGSRPRPHTFPGAQWVCTSDDLMDLEDLPASVVVVKGGYVADEMASLLAALGSKVTMLTRAQDPILTTGFDTEIWARFRETLEQQGVDIVEGILCSVEKMRAESDSCASAQPTQSDNHPQSHASSSLGCGAKGTEKVHCTGQKRSSYIVRARLQRKDAARCHGQCKCERADTAHLDVCGCAPDESVPVTAAPADLVISSLGRIACSDNIGLEHLRTTHVQQDGTNSVRLHALNRAIVTDEYQNVPGFEGLYALGDVAGRWQMTPVAKSCGRLLADRIFGGQPMARLPYHPNSIPVVVYTHPPVACVGLSEERAKAVYGRDRVRCYTTTFKPMALAFDANPVRTTMKLICAAHAAADPPSQHMVVGLHMLGEAVDEIVQGFAVCVSNALTKEQVDSVIGVHPSSAEELVSFKPWRPGTPPAVPRGWASVAVQAALRSEGGQPGCQDCSAVPLGEASGDASELQGTGWV